MIIQKLKAREADYAGPGAKMQTCEVRNFPTVAEWFNKMYSPGSRKRIERVLRLTGDNRKKFREMWGPVSFCYHGSHYFHAHLFEVEYSGESTEILVMTAKDHGTSYEAVVRRNGNLIPCDPRGIIKFLEWLSKQLPKRF